MLNHLRQVNERDLRRLERTLTRHRNIDPGEYAANLEAKTGVFLSHISIMIAVTSILFAITEKGSRLSVIFGIELVLYLLLALLCIFLQREIPLKIIDEAMGAGTPTSVHTERAMLAFRQEVVLKDRYFRFVHVALYALTIPLAITVVLAISVGAWS
jgi:hypothetical protein